MKLHFKIFRFDPEKDQDSRYQDYDVEAEPGERVLDCLNRIKWEQDGSLAFRLSCAHGVCGSCAVKINGRCALACQTLVDSLKDDDILVEPLPTFTVMRDLIVDFEPFWAKVEKVRPYLISHTPPPEAERYQSPEDREKIDEVIRCILCACCTAACPVTEENPDYLGPSALVQAFRRVFDTRDEDIDNRLKALNSEDGAFGCVNHFECTRVCPKEIKVTKSINFIKREIKNRLEDASS